MARVRAAVSILAPDLLAAETEIHKFTAKTFPAAGIHLQRLIILAALKYAWLGRRMVYPLRKTECLEIRVWKSGCTFRTSRDIRV